MHVLKWHGRLCQSQPHSLLRIHTHKYFNHFDSLIFTVGVWSTHPGCLIYEHNIWHSSLPLTHLFHASPSSFFCEAQSVVPPNFVQPSNIQINRGHTLHHCFCLKLWGGISHTFHQQLLINCISFPMSRRLAFKSISQLKKLLLCTSNLLCW